MLSLASLGVAEKPDEEEFFVGGLDLSREHEAGYDPTADTDQRNRQTAVLPRITGKGLLKRLFERR